MSGNIPVPHYKQNNTTSHVELSHFSCLLYIVFLLDPLTRSARYDDQRIPKHTRYHCTMWWYTRSPIPGVDPGGPVVIILSSGSEIRGFNHGQGRWIFSERKNPECDFLRKGSKAVGPVIDLWHVKEPQAKIRASEQNSSAFSCSMSEVTLMT